MSETSSLCICCCHFTYRRTQPYEIKIKDFIEALKVRLTSIPTLSNIKIGCPKSTLDQTMKVVAPVPPLSQGVFFPEVDHLRIEFDVHLPKHIQAKYCGDFNMPLPTEDFRVSHRFAYSSPVTSIEVLDPAEACEPSNAAEIVVGYLAEELNKEGQEVGFEYLEPLPFPVDFFVTTVDPDPTHDKIDPAKVSFTANINTQLVFPEYTFTCNQRISHASTLNAFRWVVDNELEAFFGAKAIEQKLNHKWEEIAGLMREITTAGKPVSAWNLYAKALSRIRRGRLLAETHERLGAFEAAEVFSTQMLRDSVHETYQNCDRRYFKEDVCGACENVGKYPVQGAREVVKFLEDRRAKSVEYFFIIFAALVGGIAGALVTIGFSPKQQQGASVSSSVTASPPATTAAAITTTKPSPPENRGK